MVGFPRAATGPEAPYRMKPRLLHGCPLAVATAFLSLAAYPANPPTPPVDKVADFQPPPDATAPNPPSVQILHSQGRIQIHFTGILLTANAIHGPWTTIPHTASPYLPDPAPTSPRFYRAQASADDALFSTRTVLALTLTGPFQPHFDLAFAGLPDGIFPPRREKPYFPGSAQTMGAEVPIRLRVRGNSSLQECPFPKLKLKVAREDRPGTPFAEAREIDIGTHCAEGGSGTVGRLRDQTAAFREALAYEALHTLGFIAPRVRRALIDYQDTSDAGPDGTGGWQVRRQALLLEDAEVVGERLGGRALDDAEVAALEDARFDPQLIADLRLFHVLLGNWDYELSEHGQPLWNTEVLALTNGTLVPMAGDFDLASWVTGKVRLNAPHDYRPDLPDLERETHFQLEQVRNQVSNTHFAASRDRFLQHRASLEHEAATAEVDAPGRTNAQRHLAAFFQALNP